jgi:hypothetical protein
VARVAVLIAVVAAAAVVPSAGAGEADPVEPPLRSVGVVGDSIVKQAETHIGAVLAAQGRPLAHLDLRNSTTIDDIRAATVAAVERPDGPEILVLVLGTAQAHDIYGSSESSAVGRKWETDLRGLLGAVTPHVACVRVFDIQERKTGFYTGVDRHAPEMNAVTRRVVGEFGTVEYFHYRAWTDLTGLAYDIGDGLHHNEPGRRAVARLVQDAADGCDPSTSTVPFWDIRPGHWAATEIAWMASRGLASGYDNGSYRANIGEHRIKVTRGQAINMLWNLAGAPAGVTAHGWRDGRAWLQGALDWAWSDGVARGYPDGTFRPGGSITRAEMANMIWQRAGSPVAAVPHGWSDGAPWVDPALDWIAGQGLMTGWPDGTFRPNAPITRAAIARLLYRVDLLPAPPADGQPAAGGPSVTDTSPPTTVSPPPTEPSTTAPTTTAPPAGTTPTRAPT